MLNNLRIGTRLGVGFGFLFAAVIMLALLGYWGVAAESTPENDGQALVRAFHRPSNPTTALVVINR